MNYNDDEIKVVKIYEYYEININEICYLYTKSFKDCINNYFKKFKNICEYDLIFAIDNNNVNIKISGSCMLRYELNKKIDIARENGFEFNSIDKLTIKFYTALDHNNIHRHLKFKSPILARQFLKAICRDHGNIQRFSNIFHNLELMIV